MNLLALETATDACSVAIQLKSTGGFHQHMIIAPQQHAYQLLSMIEQLLTLTGLSRTQLDGIAFGCGPGSFTGVRIAASVTQGIALALDLPVVAISTLAILAQGCYRQTQAQSIWVALDARMEEVYWGNYQIQQGLAILKGDEQVCPPSAVPIQSGQPGGYAWGNGWERYSEALVARTGQPVLPVAPFSCYPEAQDMIPLAQAAFHQGLAVPAELALPVYIRDRVIKNQIEGSSVG